jgi:hypothetical protein
VKSIKTIGLACIAMLALAVSLGASSASASQFRGEEYPVAFKGEQGLGGELVIKGKKGGTLSCYKGVLSGSASTASSTLNLVPSYSECELTGGIATTVTLNGCYYVLHSTNESAPFAGSVDIACAKEGAAIEAVAGSCKLTIPAQSSLGTVEFSNTGKGRARAIVASFNLSGLKGTYGSGCYSQTIGTFENGTLKETSTLKGSNDKETYALGVYLANEQIDEPPLLRAETYPVTMKGEAKSPSFSFNLGKFECTASNLWGWSGAATAQMPVTPEFTGCNLAGTTFVVQNNGCEFALTLAAGGPPNIGGMKLTCPGTPMTFLWGACVIRVGSQEWPGSVEIKNTGTGKARGVEWHASLTGVKYEQSSCPSSNGSFTNGQLNAVWQLTGFGEGKQQQGLWVE